MYKKSKNKYFGFFKNWLPQYLMMLIGDKKVKRKETKKWSECYNVKLDKFKKENFKTYTIQLNEHARLTVVKVVNISQNFPASPLLIC